MSNFKDLAPSERVTIEPVKDPEAMNAIYDRVMSAIEGCDSGMSMSVLAQVFYSCIPGETLSDDQALERMRAMMGLMNLMRDGYANRPRDTVAISRCVEDMTSIVRTGSYPVVLPALVYTLVAAAANGRRNDQIEGAAVTAIAGVVDALDRELGAIANGA